MVVPGRAGKKRPLGQGIPVAPCEFASLELLIYRDHTNKKALYSMSTGCVPITLRQVGAVGSIEEATISNKRQLLPCRP